MARGGRGGNWTSGRGGAGLATAVPVYLPPEGSAPAWVPANAKIHIDFLGGTPQGRAWSNGAEVAIATLLGNDPIAYDYVHDDTGYDSSLITSDGYNAIGSDLQTAFIGAAKTRILSGATIRFEHKRKTVDTYDAQALAVASETGDEFLSFDLGTIAIGITRSYPANNGSDGSDEVLPNILNGIEAVAFTLTATRMEMAAMGNTGANNLPTITFAATGVPRVAAYFDYTNDYAAVRFITIYDPLPTTAGLAELSAV